ncbi:MAG: family 10 glycosylhydrolase, partial [Candidatus Latescibacterota bacterium]|nr:family 10 glycosylhydrolase [Candidatus Latescibacterota bacterium]
MKRREFLRALSAGLAAAPVAAVMHPPVHEGWGPADVGMRGEGEKRVTKNWIWLGPDPDVSDDEYSRRFERLKRAGIDAILPEIFNNRQAFWGSEHLPVVAPVLERLIPLAHATDIEVHAWSHIMTCNVPDVMETHPEWYDVNRKGESARDKPAYVDYYRFMCPSRPGVQQFLQQRMRELAAIDGLDGIHLDYIRFPDVILAEALQPKYDLVQDSEFPEYDYCYCDVCRAGFKAAHGLDPLVDLKDPPANEAWFQYRCDLISRLVNEDLIPIGRAAGKQMTAAVFPNWRHVR